MKEEEIQLRKIEWQRLQNEADWKRKEYHQALRERDNYMQKIGPIVRRNLPTIHYQVLKMRCEGHTLEEVGKKFGVTRERIRQMEAKTSEVLTPSNSISV